VSDKQHTLAFVARVRYDDNRPSGGVVLRELISAAKYHFQLLLKEI
jgi:hypothetical protein